MKKLLGLMLLTSVVSINSFAKSECLPFFDDVDNKVITNVVKDYASGKKVKEAADMSPSIQAFDDLDKDVLSTCGAWGKQIGREELKWFFGRHPELVKPYEVQLNALDLGSAEDAMVELWAAKKAFEHIFCGQPKGAKVGGLHFRGRYKELQDRKELCRMPNNLGKEETLPGKVYTLGVSSKLGSDSLKGYALNQSASDIILQATREYLTYCRAKPTSDTGLSIDNRNYGACLVPLFKEKSYYLQFVCEVGKGIVTFYPYAGMPKGKNICKSK